MCCGLSSTVDDMLITSRSLVEVEELKHDLKNKFEIKNLGNAKRILAWIFLEIGEMANYG